MGTLCTVAIYCGVLYSFIFNFTDSFGINELFTSFIRDRWWGRGGRKKCNFERIKVVWNHNADSNGTVCPVVSLLFGYSPIYRYLHSILFMAWVKEVSGNSI